MHKVSFTSVSSGMIEDALSSQIDAIRLSRNITQSRLAKEAGVSRSTITRLTQSGKGISLDSFIRILKALGLEARLETLLPTVEQSPLQRLAKPVKARRRARAKSKIKAPSQNPLTDDTRWTWEDSGVD